MIWLINDMTAEAFLVYIAAMAVVLFTGLAFHEFCHAWAANELGDDTAARQGRLTLNPLAHLDPIGAAAIFLIGFGWAKPTPVNPWRLRNGPRRGQRQPQNAQDGQDLHVRSFAGGRASSERPET